MRKGHISVNVLGSVADINFRNEAAINFAYFAFLCCTIKKKKLQICYFFYFTLLFLLSVTNNVNYS